MLCFAAGTALQPFGIMKSHTLGTLAFLATLFFSANAFPGEPAAAQKTAIESGSGVPASIDIFSLQSTYTGGANIRNIRNPFVPFPIGKQDSLYTDIIYGHRIPIKGNWFLRLGAEYQRYDFGGSPSPLPSRLQAAAGQIALEYVVYDNVAVQVEADPGFFFENDISSRNFDVPIHAFTSFIIKKDSVFGVIGFAEGQFFKPTVSPIFGVTWLINDKTRLEGVFPRPSLVYDLNDDWEFRLGAELGGYGFRVDKNGRTPATHAGSVLMYTYDQAGALVTYKGWKHYELSLGAGYDFQREFDYFRDGPAQKFKAAPAPYVRIGIEAKF